MRLLARWRRQRTMNCSEVGQLLQFYLDGELDRDRSAKLAEHLDACLRCGLEANAYERIKISLATRGPEIEDDPALSRLRQFAAELLNGEKAPDA